MSEEQEVLILAHLDQHHNQSVREIIDATNLRSADVRRTLAKLKSEGEVIMHTEDRKVKGWGRKGNLQIWSRSPDANL